MKLKKILYGLMGIYIFTLCFLAQAAVNTINQSYPPYPNVWGYDLSEIPAMKWGLSNVAAYRMDDGDIWFIISHSYKKTNPLDCMSQDIDHKYILLKFFKGEQTILSENEIEAVYKITENKEIEFDYSHKKISFSDHSTLHNYYGLMPKSCFIPDFYRNYLIKTDSKGQEKKYSVLVAAPQVTIHPYDDLCEEEEGSFLYQKLDLLSQIISLDDDTFILFENGGNLILRFDKDFKTKFKPLTSVCLFGNYIMRNFFVIDYSVIENLSSQFAKKSVPIYQNVHDALLLLFHKQYSNAVHSDKE